MIAKPSSFARARAPIPAIGVIGRAKIASKGCDYLVINRVGWTETFGSATNSVTVLNDSGDIVMEASGDKNNVADRILDLIS